MADDLTLEELRRMAADIGFARMTDDHLEQLARATKAARGRRGFLRAETLTPADEPAHVYRPGPEVVR